MCVSYGQVAIVFSRCDCLVLLNSCFVRQFSRNDWSSKGHHVQMQAHGGKPLLNAARED